MAASHPNLRAIPSVDSDTNGVIDSGKAGLSDHPVAMKDHFLYHTGIAWVMWLS